MPKVLSYEAVIRGGATIENRLIVPVVTTDPVAPADGQVWVNTTNGVLNYRTGGATQPLAPQSLDAEGVMDLVGAALLGGNNLDVTYDDAAGTITLDVQALTSADITDFIAAVRGAISGGSTPTAATTVTGGVVAVDVTNSPALGGQVPAFYTNVDNHTDGLVNHTFTAADDTKLAGIQDGATANATDAFLRDRANHTGTQLAATISDFITAARDAISVTDTGTFDLTYVAGVLSGVVLDSPTVGGRSEAFLRSADNHTDGTVNRLYTAGEKTKLAGIQDGATANATDAALRDRATHTGTQTAATISDFATAVAALNIDAETLNGMTAAEIQTAVTAAIVDTAPGTLDTLNELAAALGDDPNFATTITNALNARSRNYTVALTGGALTETVTHNLGTRHLLAQVFVEAGEYEDEDYIIRRPTLNTVLVVSEGPVIPAGRRIVIHAVGN